MVIPTVGRIVWFYEFGTASGRPFLAYIDHVHNNRLVDLTMTNRLRFPVGLSNVILVQDGDMVPLANYCMWIPDQSPRARRRVA